MGLGAGAAATGVPGICPALRAPLMRLGCIHLDPSPWSTVAVLGETHLLQRQKET